MPHDLNPAALSAAQVAGEATYMAATDDREALPQAVEAAIGAYLEGLDAAGFRIVPEGEWQPIETAPKTAKILAKNWRPALAGWPGEWSKSDIYEWSPIHKYWTTLSRGECIWPQYQDSYVCLVLPDDPKPPSLPLPPKDTP